MAQANEGDTVKVHYTGKLDDGTVFDTSQDKTPIEFTLGAGQVIPGFEKAIQGMEAGQSKTETIPADLAYGPRRDELLMEVQKEQFPENVDPEKGQQLQVRDPQGQAAQVIVHEVKDETVVLDANHPLAGRDLTFDIELVDVQKNSS